MDCSSLCFSVHGIPQERILAWVAISFSRGSSKLQDRARVSCIAGIYFTREAHVIEEETQLAKGTYEETLQCNKGTTCQNPCQIPFYLHTHRQKFKSFLFFTFNFYSSLNFFFCLNQKYGSYFISFSFMDVCSVASVMSNFLSPYGM